MLLHNSTLYNFIENIEAERKYALSKPIRRKVMYSFYFKYHTLIKTSHFRSKTYFIMLNLKKLCNLIFNEILLNSRFMQDLMKKEKPVKRETKPYV